ncbi:MAG: GMC family oxidoreductase N-terminal domain-containing protein, partial [Pseudomonadota bacterium]|nr:GMC family oxidoreductase N-terminal domain-containing protein [Pseudomonadota bacterium]
MRGPPDHADVLIVGGGTAGCILASRLSENGRVRVVLVEAGPDVTENSAPLEVRQAYPSRAFFTREFFHPGLFGKFGDVAGAGPRQRQKARYEQARVLGGGSTINGLVGNRGAPSDYDEWAAMGATGWGWDDVLPYFRKLERDLDFDGPYHGRSGPISVRRLRREQTTGFVQKSFEVLKAHGFEERADQNAEWVDGTM